jgi:hypothetical protein
MGAQSRFRVLAWMVASLCLVAAGMQFIRPELPNPPVTAELQAPADVKQILRTACYNCHSNETTLSWFDEPVPAYWIVHRHVTDGRNKLNFSTIGKLPVAQQTGILFESVSQIELGAMPLPAYAVLHSESVVTPQQLTVLKNYLTAITPEKIAGTDEINAATAQYDEWIHGGAAKTTEASASSAATPASNVTAAPNGIAFIPEYKNWRAISSTDRSDNYTIREILGNDVAVRAIAENRIDPWPDGTAFAKVAWLQQADAKGAVRAGAFFQVEFMIRNSEKYAQSLGWGFARWRGPELKPYGQDANFAGECVGCHQPLARTNYVFTMPIRGQQ